MESNCSTWIYEELWLDIFKRLPLKSVCKLLCVCKYWKSLVSSPFFINLHHSVTSANIPTKLKPYLLQCDTSCHNSYALCRPQETCVEHVRIVHFPFRSWADPQGVKFTLVDVICGVACLSYSLDSSFDSLVLWNPSIHKYVSVPRVPFGAHLDAIESVFRYSKYVTRFCNTYIGFGYDKSKYDFKIVRIRFPFFQESTAISYEVYSVQDGIWRGATTNINIKHHGLLFTRGRTSCFVNGTIHWLVPYFHTRDSVLMFDCEREEFKTMEFPEEIYRNDQWGGFRLELIEHAGMLSALVRSDERSIEAWVMKNHGWKKAFRSTYPFAMSFDDDFNIVRYCDERFNKLLSEHVYEESMFLIDVTEAESYTKEDMVQISHSKGVITNCSRLWNS